MVQANGNCPIYALFAASVCVSVAVVLLQTDYRDAWTEPIGCRAKMGDFLTFQQQQQQRLESNDINK